MNGAPERPERNQSVVFRDPHEPLVVRPVLAEVHHRRAFFQSSERGQKLMGFVVFDVAVALKAPAFALANEVWDIGPCPSHALEGHVLEIIRAEERNRPDRWTFFTERNAGARLPLPPGNASPALGDRDVMGLDGKQDRVVVIENVVDFAPIDVSQIESDVFERGKRDFV